MILNYYYFIFINYFNNEKNYPFLQYKNCLHIYIKLKNKNIIGILYYLT